MKLMRFCLIKRKKESYDRKLQMQRVKEEHYNTSSNSQNTSNNTYKNTNSNNKKIIIQNLTHKKKSYS